MQWPAFVTYKKFHCCLIYCLFTCLVIVRVAHGDWNIVKIWDSVINPRDNVFPNSDILEKVFLRTRDWCAISDILEKVFLRARDWCAIQDNYDIVAVPTTPSGGRCRGQRVTLGCRSLRLGSLNSISQMSQTTTWEKTSQCNNHNISVVPRKSEVQQKQIQ